MYIYENISLSSSYNEKCIRQNLHLNSKHTCHVAKVFFENRAVYEIMWQNIVQLGKPQVTIWRMRIAWWIPKTTNIYPEYVITITFLSTMVARTRLNIMLYVRWLSCYLIVPKLHGELSWYIYIYIYTMRVRHICWSN
jgi:hypothetical protein